MDDSIHVLIIDDEQSIRWVLQQTFSRFGYTLLMAETAAEAKRLMRTRPVDIAFIDINLPDQDGLSLMEEMLQRFPSLLAIVITGQSTMRNTITAMKKGAYEYIAKPFDIEEAESLVKQAATVVLSNRASQKTNQFVRKGKEELLVGNSKTMHALYKAVGRVASTDLTVLILGESGTGKELIARSIHQHSARANRPFIALNCAAIPSELLESELFGHEKGAFTGAGERKRGKLELAHTGTLFLDEIGDMPLGLQSKLLRVLQEKIFERVGGHEEVKTDMRVIAATHRTLEKLVKEGLFRTDLYYRINVFSIYVPPLREHREDILLLTEHFLRKGQKEMAVYNKRLAPEVLSKLQQYHWPGNIRELENVIKSLMIANVSEIITLDTLPLNILRPSLYVEEEGNLEALVYSKIKSTVALYIQQEGTALMDFIMPQLERPLLKLTLENTKWNQNRSARILGINRNTLRKKIELLELRKDDGSHTID